ncbi:unnamed protein product [Lactuca virosa]|uniref:Phospholipase-like protein n=1 Tax=Lactuca virosa TaxID=75947 RepID=A0AAU9LX30_9ASTR|nr:unnamed protein product [Lactuca virosa]
MASRLSGFSGIQPENVLMDAVQRLLPLPSSCPELLDVLAHMEQNLSMVNQMPSESMKHAMHPIAEALIAKEVAGDRDMDVNISVVSCICEILRIMAPDPPYNDKQLQDFFELTTMTFEKLSSSSGGCYTRMTKVLKIFRKAKFPLLMLDLKIDKLVVQLFRQFLTVADFNPPVVVLEMEMIMSMIMKERDAPMAELVELLVMSVRNSNQIDLPVCWQLGEKVLKNCVAQLKSHLPDFVSKMGIPLQDYSNMVAQICNGIHFEDEKKTLLMSNDPIMSSKSKTGVKGKRKRKCTSPKKKASPLEVSSSESCIICVKGYNVKSNIAPILESIFMKHGDIAAECLFKTASVRESFLQVICEVVTQLQTNDEKTIISKMEEIERQVSEAEAANIHVSWLRSYLEAFCKRRESMEIKAKTGMLKKAAEMEVRERRAELMAAQKRFEKCMKVLDLVEKNLNHNILDSKTEQDLWFERMAARPPLIFTYSRRGK